MLSIKIDPQHEDETIDEFTERISTFIHNVLKNLHNIQTELKNGDTVEDLDEATAEAILALNFTSIGLNTGYDLEGNPIVVIS